SCPRFFGACCVCKRLCRHSKESPVRPSPVPAASGVSDDAATLSSVVHEEGLVPGSSAHAESPRDCAATPRSLRLGQVPFLQRLASVLPPAGSVLSCTRTDS